ncbi:MAG: nuclear transport factor 2 family protein [Thermoleophilaceae bacterium]|nr:nuclear transport factor 2 family protein [Thermoleophilaceae bacterium]
MSQGNVENVCRIYEHLNRGEIEDVVRRCSDDFVMDMSGRIFNPDTYTGHDGVRRFYADATEAWASYRWGVEETRVRGDSVVALLHCTAQSRDAAPPVDWDVAWLWRFRGDEATSVRFYRDRAEALEAAGLSE